MTSRQNKGGVRVNRMWKGISGTAIVRASDSVRARARADLGQDNSPDKSEKCSARQKKE